MTTPPEVRGSYVLLADAGRTTNGHGSKLISLEPDSSGLEPKFLIEDHGARYAAGLAAASKGEAAQRTALLPGPPLRLLVEEFNPAERAHEHAAAHAWLPLAAETGPSLRLETEIADPRDVRPPHSLKLAVLGVQSLFAFLIATQIQFVAPEFQADSPNEYQEIALVAPTTEELRDLTGQEPEPEGESTLFTGDQQDIVRDIYSPEPPAPEPGTPAPETLTADPEDEPEQPKQEDPPEELAADDPPEEPDPTDEPDAFSPIPEAEERPTQVAKSPSPGETRSGNDSARRRDSRFLPPPKTLRRSPQITIEDPRATMPGERGPIELGSLRIPDRPDQRMRQNINQAQRSGSGRQAVGDTFGTGGMGGYLPPSKGTTKSDVELLTDPKGVDFRPYLIQILNSVRRNWYAVIPESARLGMNRGRVQIQFIVAKDGTVPKLVISSPSGAVSLDRAAVAGISASNPFPPLPRDFNGKEVRLQFTFLYNIKRR